MNPRHRHRIIMDAEGISLDDVVVAVLQWVHATGHFLGWWITVFRICCPLCPPIAVLLFLIR